MQMILFAGLLLGAAQAAPQAGGKPPIDPGTMAASCGGDLTVGEMAALPRAEAEAKMACFLREGAKQFNRNLPLKVDEITTLERLSTEGARLTYHYVIDRPAAEVPETMREALRTATKAQVCKAEDMRATIRAGGSYRYLWVDRMRTPLAETVVSAC